MAHSPDQQLLPSAADGIAAGLSFLCVLHCLLLPLAIALLPATLGAFGLPEEFHLFLFVIAVPVSSYAIIAGVRRHGLWLPVAVAVAGLTLIGIGAFAGLSEPAEIGITVTGSVLLAYAHLRNWRARRLATG